MKYELTNTLNVGVYPRELLTWFLTGDLDTSTTVKNIRQITPYLKKQTQFYLFFAPKRRFYKKQTQFAEGEKMNAFVWIWNLTIVLIMLLADVTTLKGANFFWPFIPTKFMYCLYPAVFCP